ncbi:MAG: phage head closure protein [Acetobacteraceae bacterium]
MTCRPACNPKLQLKPGDLRHAVTIEQRSRTDDGAGGGIETWSTFASAYASIQPQQGREMFLDGQMVTIQRIKVRMRYLPGLTTAHRIRFGSRLLNIREVLNIEERNIVHELICDEGASNG